MARTKFTDRKKQAAKEKAEKFLKTTCAVIDENKPTARGKAKKPKCDSDKAAKYLEQTLNTIKDKDKPKRPTAQQIYNAQYKAMLKGKGRKDAITQLFDAPKTKKSKSSSGSSGSGSNPPVEDDMQDAMQGGGGDYDSPKRKRSPQPKRKRSLSPKRKRSPPPKRTNRSFCSKAALALRLCPGSGKGPVRNM